MIQSPGLEGAIMGTERKARPICRVMVEYQLEAEAWQMVSSSDDSEEITLRRLKHQS